MDDLLSALLGAGLIDADTADTIRRQNDPEAARTWAETTLTTTALGALSAQQQRLLALLRDTDFRPTERALADFWQRENELLWDAMRPRITEVLNERSTYAAVVGGNVGTFNLVNQQVMRWAETYYIDPSDTTYGSIPNLNLTSREQFTQAFLAWNSGELGGRADGLPQLIRALVPTFGIDRAERIAVTETTRLFTESIRQAGLANPFTTAFSVLVTNDERVCPICGGVADTVVAKTDENGFVHPERGSIGFPPFHVKCRCGITEETEGTLRLRQQQPGQQPPATETSTVTEPEPTLAPSLTLYRPSADTMRLVNEVVSADVARVARLYGMTPEEVEAEVSKALQDLVNSKPLSIQFKSRFLDSLLTDGRFKTQFETNTSGGALAQDTRATAELRGLGMPLDVDPKLRPIYGYVNVGNRAQQMVSSYGNITFVLKDEVRDRTTITVGDSLYNYLQRQVASTPITSITREAWDSEVPSLFQYAQDGNANRLVENVGYLEVQIQGGVSLADIKEITDKLNVITPAQREQLEGMGIKIWR